MTTSRDLMIIAMDAAPDRPVEQGDLSLALAGAEVIDLLDCRAVTLDGDHIVPGPRPTTADPLLEQAASSLVREVPPYESVGDWLWRRGRDLSAAYLQALEAEGLLSRQRRGMSFRAGPLVLADSSERRAAADRRASGEPILTALAEAIGIQGEGGEGGENGEGGEDAAGFSSTDDDAVDTVLAAVIDALMQLEALRQRRAIEQAAFDNIWRGD
ncbi:GOLPH3/VPS74 family protein [Streptomyces hiroshimensis]|uniref:GPP34 family phosphoprotein n=1 Tax=Streptomyces hiroshimensis TaxID=66424 RepID=A0ABQ2YB11_9ACTN|nr:GPP34 family phosphoprotein [Streptomyces hiroshimensis]GGX76096.1 hypothetical protein GCM10010324_22090 [Streptomyces hiroshimensis]